MSDDQIRAITSGLSDIKVAVGVLNAKIDGITADNTRGEGVHQDHENRIRALEKVRWMIAGGCLLAGSGLGAWLSQTLGG